MPLVPLRLKFYEACIRLLGYLIITQDFDFHNSKTFFVVPNIFGASHCGKGQIRTYQFKIGTMKIPES